jgi:hypothetical protein
MFLEVWLGVFETPAYTTPKLRMPLSHGMCMLHVQHQSRCGPCGLAVQLSCAFEQAHKVDACCPVTCLCKPGPGDAKLTHMIDCHCTSAASDALCVMDGGCVRLAAGRGLRWCVLCLLARRAVREQLVCRVMQCRAAHLQVHGGAVFVCSVCGYLAKVTKSPPALCVW